MRPTHEQIILGQVRDIAECVLCVIVIIAVLIFGKFWSDTQGYSVGYDEGFSAACEMYEHPVEIGYPIE